MQYTYEENIDVITDQIVGIIRTDQNGNIFYIPIDENNKDYRLYLESLES